MDNLKLQKNLFWKKNNERGKNNTFAFNIHAVTQKLHSRSFHIDFLWVGGWHSKAQHLYQNAICVR